MAAARFWRVLDMSSYADGPVIELGEFGLLVGGARVDAAAVLTCTHDLISGTLAALGDASTASVAVLPRGAALLWDFGGSPQDVSDVRLGAGAGPAAFPFGLCLQRSTDGVTYTDVLRLDAITYPGARQMTSSAWSDITMQRRFNVLGLPMDGAAGGSAFVEINGKTVTPTNAVTSAVQRRFGPTSLRLNGNGYLTVPHSPDFNLGAVDFTIDFWFYAETAANATTTRYILAKGNVDYTTGYVVGLRGANNTLFAQVAYGSEMLLTGTTAVTLNAWHHARFVREGASYALLLDGVIQATGRVSSSTDNTAPLVIGYDPRNAARGFVGYLDDFAIYKGVSRGLGGFVPPSDAALGHIVLRNPVGRVEAPPVGVVESDGAMPSGAVAPVLGTGLRARADFRFDPAARGRVRGTVYIDGTPDVPFSSRVVLLRAIDWMPIAEQWSDPVTGAYDFHWVEMEQRYVPVTADHLGVHAAVATGPMTPEPMPAEAL